MLLFVKVMLKLEGHCRNIFHSAPMECFTVKLSLSADACSLTLYNFSCTILRSICLSEAYPFIANSVLQNNSGTFSTNQ